MLQQFPKWSGFLVKRSLLPALNLSSASLILSSTNQCRHDLKVSTKCACCLCSTSYTFSAFNLKIEQSFCTFSVHFEQKMKVGSRDNKKHVCQQIRAFQLQVNQESGKRGLNRFRFDRVTATRGRGRSASSPCACI